MVMRSLSVSASSTGFCLLNGLLTVFATRMENCSTKSGDNEREDGYLRLEVSVSHIRLPLKSTSVISSFITYSYKGPKYASLSIISFLF